MFVKYPMPRAPHYSGTLIVLGGAWTGSQGEGRVIGLHAAVKAHTMASEMGDLLEPFGVNRWATVTPPLSWPAKHCST